MKRNSIAQEIAKREGQREAAELSLRTIRQTQEDYYTKEQIPRTQSLDEQQMAEFIALLHERLQKLQQLQQENPQLSPSLRR